MVDSRSGPSVVLVHGGFADAGSLARSPSPTWQPT